MITTEKDAVRMISSGFLTESLKERLWYLPIRIEVLFDQQDIFEKIITDYVAISETAVFKMLQT